MKDRRSKHRRKMSAGSVFMLAMLAVVLCGSVLVLGRLSSGASVDLNRLQMTVLDLQSGNRNEADDTDEQPEDNEIKTNAGSIATPHKIGRAHV